MPESGLPANKIEELRRRFEEQPASRIFLQLAEEYRRLGLPEQAVEVLETGLAKRPGDLSGMVALGRCRLELGLLARAVEILEAVIARDAAHLVANKLLIEAHLQQGDPDRAGQRLDLYKLLNDRDPEIDDLETRLKSLRRGAREAAEAHAFEELSPPVQIPSEDPFAAALAAVQATEPAAPPPAIEPVFEPEPPPAPSEPLPTILAEALPERAGVVFTLSPLPAVTLDALWQASDARPRTLRRRVEPFGPLPAPSARDLRTMLTGGVVFPPAILAEPPAVAAEEIFIEAPLAEAPPAQVPPAEAPSAQAPSAEAPPFEPVEATIEVSAADVLASRPPYDPFQDALEDEPSTVAIDLPEPVELPSAAREPVIEEPVIEEPILAAPRDAQTAPEPEIPAATVTLAELYLAQGHVAEAQRIFAEVLARDPHNALARAALARLEPAPPQRLSAAHLLALLPAAEVPQGLTAKKILVLSAYLQRLRRRHVR